MNAIYLNGADSLTSLRLGENNPLYIGKASNFELKVINGVEYLFYNSTDSKKGLIVKHLKKNTEMFFL